MQLAGEESQNGLSERRVSAKGCCILILWNDTSLKGLNCSEVLELHKTLIVVKISKAQKML